MFDLYCAWIEEHGIAPRCTSSDPNEKNIARWASYQRTKYRNNTLPRPQIDALEALPSWSWDPLHDRFHARYTELRRFLDEHNGRYPSFCSEDPAEKMLSSWVSTRKLEYNRQKLSVERIRLLERLPKWMWEGKQHSEMKFDENFALMQHWAAEHGSARPGPKSKDPLERKLSTWVQHCRIKYRNGKMSPEHVERLESLPRWSWTPYEDNFAEMIEGLRKWHLEHPEKRPYMHAKYDAHQRKIGQFLTNRSQEYKKGILSPEKKQRLEETVFQWYPVA